MTKKNSSPKNTNLPRRLREDLYQANNLITEGKPEQALKILHELEDKFHRQSDVLGLMANAYLDTNNQHEYLHTIYKVHEITPTRPEVKLGLAGAYLANGYPVLALQTFQQFLKHWPHDERAADVKKPSKYWKKSWKKSLLNWVIRQKRILNLQPFTMKQGS